MDDKNSPSSWSRRNFIRVAGLGVTGAALTGTLGACGDAATSTSAASTPAQSATNSVAAATTSGGTASTSVASTTLVGGAPTVLSQGQTLQIAIFGDQAAATNSKTLTASFVQKFPGVTLNFIPIAGNDWDEFFTKILALKATNKTPDLVYVATEGLQIFAGKDLATPLDDYVKRDKAAMASYFSDVHPSLVEAMMYEGSLFALPNDWNAPNMFINTRLFAEAGYSDISSDWDKDKFYEIAKKITKKDSSGRTSVYGYQWVNRLWGSWLPWVYVNGSNIMTEEEAPNGDWLWSSFYPNVPSVKGRGGGWRYKQPKANDPANIEALQFMMQLKNEGITPSIDLGGGQSLESILANNKLGMTPAGGFWAGGLKNAGLAADSFDVRLFPKWKSQRHQFGTAGYVITRDAKNKDLAWEFMKYTVSVDFMNEFFKGNNSTPTRRSMMTAQRYATTGPKNWQVFYDTLDQHPDTAPIPAPPQANPMTAIFTKYTGLAMAGEKSAKDALDGMQKDLEALFKRS